MYWDSADGISDMFLATFLVVITTAVATRYIYGSGTAEWRENFLGWLIFIFLLVQFYYLSFAALHLPYTSNDDLLRYDCLESTKGGKRADGSKLFPDINPCFCYQNATCFNKQTDEKINGTCPTDKTAYCLENINNQKIKLYLDEERDCLTGQIGKCTKNEPCTPCELEKLESFNAPRCRTCTTENKGDCGFIEDVGPYCWKDPNTKEIEPCKICCTESVLTDTREVLTVNNQCWY